MGEIINECNILVRKPVRMRSPVRHRHGRKYTIRNESYRNRIVRIWLDSYGSVVDSCDHGCIKGTEFFAQLIGHQFPKKNCCP
jgi:hypothetical protein